MIVLAILAFALAMPIGALSWWFMRTSKEPERRAKWDFHWGLLAPAMQPHWDRLLTWASPEAAMLLLAWRADRAIEAARRAKNGQATPAWWRRWLAYLGLGLRLAKAWIHDKAEALKNIGSEWCRLDAMRAFKVMSNVAIFYGLIGLTFGFAIGRFA